MNTIYNFLKKMNENSIIIECGGHLGTDTLNLCNIFNKGTIYCIECNPSLYEKLKKKFIDNTNIKTFNIALSDKNKKFDFFVDENIEGDSGASSLLEASEFYLNNYIKKEKKIQVEGQTLEYFLNNNNINNVDLLWLDVEGFEYYILKSSIDCLKKNVKYIYTEVNFQEFRKETKLYIDIKNLLINNNFEEIEKWEQGAEWGEWQGNVLFKNINL